MFDHRPPTKVARREASTYPRVKKSVRGLKSESWFDGTTESLRAREGRVRDVTRQVRELLSSTEPLSLEAEAEAVTWLGELEEESRALSQLSQEYIEASYQDHITSLPQYSVMAGSKKKYTHPVGTPDPEVEISSDFWKRFCYTEPHLLLSKHSHLLGSSQGLREQAVDFVVQATGSLSNERVRAKIIDVFVSNVERLRRAAVKSQENTPKTARTRTPAAPDSLLFD